MKRHLISFKLDLLVFPHSNHKILYLFYGPNLQLRPFLSDILELQMQVRLGIFITQQEENDKLVMYHHHYHNKYQILSH